MTVIAGVKVHSAAEVFPLLDGAEFDALCEDIQKNGLCEPLWRVWLDAGIGNGTQEPWLLDGRNRLRACERVGVKPEWRTYEGDDPIGFVVSLNMHRRHLTESQRALVAAKIANMRSGHRTDLAPMGAAASQDDAAQLLNVGRRSVQRARQVLDQGAPELVAAVERGDVKVRPAAEVARLPAEKQREIVAEGPKAVQRAAAEARTEKKRDPEPEDDASDADEFVPEVAAHRLNKMIDAFVRNEWPSGEPIEALLVVFDSWKQFVQRRMKEERGNHG